MLHTAIHPKSRDFLQASQRRYYFYDELSTESQEARYRIHEFLLTQYHHSGKLEKSDSGIPLPIILQGGKKLYWSLSHIENYIAYILTDMPCGIDIVEHFPRSDDLLFLHKKEEYMIIGGSLWDAFYIIWSAKEALIKKLSLCLDNMSSIEIIARSNSHHSCILRYMGREHTVSYLQESKYTLAYTFSF